MATRVGEGTRIGEERQLGFDPDGVIGFAVDSVVSRLVGDTSLDLQQNPIVWGQGVVRGEAGQWGQAREPVAATAVAYARSPHFPSSEGSVKPRVATDRTEIGRGEPLGSGFQIDDRQVESITAVAHVPERGEIDLITFEPTAWPGEKVIDT